MKKKFIILNLHFSYFDVAINALAWRELNFPLRSFFQRKYKTSKIKRFYRFINRIMLHRTMAVPKANFMNTLCLLSLMFANKTLWKSYRINLFIPLFPRFWYLRDTEKFTEKYHIFVITGICFYKSTTKKFTKIWSNSASTQTKR